VVPGTTDGRVILSLLPSRRSVPFVIRHSSLLVGSCQTMGCDLRYLLSNWSSRLPTCTDCALFVYQNIVVSVTVAGMPSRHTVQQTTLRVLYDWINPHPTQVAFGFATVNRRDSHSAQTSDHGSAWTKDTTPAVTFPARSLCPLQVRRSSWIPAIICP